MSSEPMKFVKFLGRGSYGSVDLFSRRRVDGSVLFEAVKTTSDRKSLEKEHRILTHLRGRRGIVQLSSENTKSLVEQPDSNGNSIFKMPMEYAPGGSLFALINTSTRLSDSIIRNFTRMFLQGLVSIHSAGFVHCDLKPDNLLLFPRFHDASCSFELKIADFGLSTKAGEQSDLWDVGAPWVGTPVYMSPESIQQSIVEPSLDLWSLGCIVLEMYTGSYPWCGLAIDEVESCLMYDRAPTISFAVPSDAKLFVQKCFSRDPKERGTASELLSHPFLMMSEKAKHRKRKLDEPKLNDITTTKKLKTIPQNPIIFKPLKMNIIPQRSDCVPVQ